MRAPRQRTKALTLATTLLALGACSRHLDLEEPGDAGIVVVSGPEPPDEIPVVEDSGITSVELPLCSERPTGECLGANDFPCVFPAWVNLAADTCEAELDCRVQGWLGVSLGEEGCVSAIEMTEPNADFVACLVREFGSESCPQCPATHATRFLGSTDVACMKRCVEDIQCPPSYHCEGELCVHELG